MVQYIHHVTGRLRVKLASLKRNPVQAAAIKALLESTAGISKAEIKLVTGSLIVTYDREMIHPQAILQALYDHGHCGSVVPMLPASVASSKRKVQIRGTTVAQAGRGFGKALSKAVLDAVMEKMLQRSAAALIGAIL